MQAIAAEWRMAAPGIALAAVVAGAAFAVNAAFGGAVMLYALLFGMPLQKLSLRARWQPGVTFAAKRILRFGVALLGLRLTLSDVFALGLPTLVLVVAAISLTMTGGVLLARLCGLRGDFAVLTAGAVAICGASAALAVAAVLPQHGGSERQTILTVVGVTALSTVAMVLYPLLTTWWGLGDVNAGIFFGATIHDVAQVVGAGDTVSPEARDTATLVKLMRVACLIPVVALVAVIFRRREAVADAPGAVQTPALPLFLIAFVVLMLLNSAALIPPSAVALLSQLSKLCLVVAVAALGIKTSLTEMLSVGPGPVAAIFLQTVLLGLFVAAVIYVAY